jgi:hypothetical protein
MPEDAFAKYLSEINEAYLRGMRQMGLSLEVAERGGIGAGDGGEGRAS